MRQLQRAAALASLASLGGCSGLQQFWILRPRGPIAGASIQAMLVDVGAMLLIIGPTTLLVTWCIWRYRHSRSARYTPKWEHSLPVEILSWGVPLVIVAFLSYLSYRSTFAVNPFGPGLMTASGNADNARPPINVDVITTDWQWLFVYPDQHVASANELDIPDHTPVRFRMTSATVSNDMLIPQLMGQIDLMPGMLTKQGLIANHDGVYQGLAADFSGPGFSWMQFDVKVMPRQSFDAWVADTGRTGQPLAYPDFVSFAQPRINETSHVVYFKDPEPGLLDHVIADNIAGKLYPTPPKMAEKQTAQENGRQQPLGHARAATKS